MAACVPYFRINIRKGVLIMKLIFAVINNDDSHAVSSSLTKAGYSATKLSSTGGFLMSGNTTFLICAENESVDAVIEIIKHCIWEITLEQ